MPEITPKKFREMREAYASVYSQTNDINDSEVLSEEQLFESFYIEIEDLFMSLNKQDLTEGGKREAIMQGLKAIWPLVRGPVKALTGMGSQPTTKTGRVVRAVQTATIPATVVANPLGSRDIAVGAVTGAVKGAFQGGSEAAGKKEQQQTQKSSSSDLVVPSGYEIGPDGKPRRRQ